MTGGDDERPKIKVTDRRISAREDVPAPAGGEADAAGGARMPPRPVRVMNSRGPAPRLPSTSTT